LRFVSKKTVILINLCMWVLATMAYGIPWSQDYHRLGLRLDLQNRTICEPQYPPAMSFSFAALSFVVPSVTMLIIYKKLYSYSKRTSKKFELIFKTLQLNYPDLDPKIPFQSEQRATTTIGLTMAAFIACWSPFFIVVMLRAISKDLCCTRDVYMVREFLNPNFQFF
jgi:7 transmembrane receptor (rhodopsin family)